MDIIDEVLAADVMEGDIIRHNGSEYEIVRVEDHDENMLFVLENDEEVSVRWDSKVSLYGYVEVEV